MKRQVTPRLLSGGTVVLLAVLSSSCLNFDDQLARCRVGGVWICGGASVGDAGIDDAGSREALTCNRGWCWDHPRPTGVVLESVWGTGPNDVWVAGQLGTLLHFDGLNWQSYNQDARHRFTSICGHDGTVYFGSAASLQLNRLFKWNGTLSEVQGSQSDINQLSCGPSALWLAQEVGGSRMDWATSVITRQFNLTAGTDERCTSVAEDTNGCVMGCMADGTVTPFMRVRGCDGGLEHEVIDDGGLGASFGVRTLWVDPNRGTLAGLTGSRGEIWQRDAGWAPTWSGALNFNKDVYAGAPTSQGSIAVGANGLVVDLTANGAVETYVPSSGNSYHHGVWSPPSGDAWVVGERGCILQRDAGVWVPRSACAVGFEDFSTEPRFAAITENALYERGPDGWAFVKSLTTGQRSFWAFPDGGGYAYLSESRLETPRGVLPVSFDDARRMFVVSEDRVVIARANGTLLDTNLRGSSSVSFDAGVVISSLSGEADGTVWAAGAAGVVLRSSSAGVWTVEDVGLTFDISELALGFGRQWALSGNQLATRQLGMGWTKHTLTQGAFERVVPIDAQTALLFRDDNVSALRVTSGFEVQVIGAPPTRLSGRIVMRGDEVWAAGWEGGLVRFPIR